MKRLWKLLFPGAAMASALALTAGIVVADGDAQPAAKDPGNRLADPVKLIASDEAINVDVGHAHPLMADLDGDGVRDLLVGQFGGGKLRLYRNAGTNAEPSFTAFDYVAGPNEAALNIPSG